MNGKMKVWQQTGIMTQEFVERDIPQPKPGEVQVKIKCTGICGSDMHYLEHGRIGDFVVDYPFVLGHESAGEVTALGEGVTDLKVGDRVTLEPGYTCGQCEFCKTGRYNLCPDVVFFATPPYDGTLAEYVSHPAHMCFKLPEKVDYCEGALIEPLSVGFHAALQGDAKPGQTAMVVGCGCIGIVTMLALKSMGISKVYMSDVIDVRLEKAKSLGAQAVFNPMKEDVDEALKKATGGKGADLVIETAGNSKAQAQCVDLVKTGGTIVYVGMAAQAVTPIDINQIIGKEATIKSVFRYRNLYPVALSAVENGLPLKKVVSDSFDFKQTDKAFEYNINNKADVTKIVIEY